jgi:hypothetical protein
MTCIVSPKMAARRNELAVLLRKLRSIFRSGLPADPLLDRLKCALAEAGSLGRLVTIVPLPGCTAAGPRLSFAIDKEMMNTPQGHDSQSAPVRRGCRRGRNSTRDFLRVYSPKSAGARVVAVLEIDDHEPIAQGAD